MAETDDDNENDLAESNGKSEIIEESGNRRAVVAETKFSSGPLPAPEEFQRYGEVLPDAPERILRMAEHELEMHTTGRCADLVQIPVTGRQEPTTGGDPDPQQQQIRQRNRRRVDSTA